MNQYEESLPKYGKSKALNAFERINKIRYEIEKRRKEEGFSPVTVDMIKKWRDTDRKY